MVSPVGAWPPAAVNAECTADLRPLARTPGPRPRPEARAGNDPERAIRRRRRGVPAGGPRASGVRSAMADAARSTAPRPRLMGGRATRDAAAPDLMGRRT